MLAYLFPGQGSQFKGMGETLFDEFPEHTAEADAILGYSVKELCLEDPEQKLNKTQFTQPAIYVVNALSFLKQNSAKPDYAAGHSLGEYNALFAAEVFSFSTGLKLVKKRGELMSEAKQGGMAAVIGLQAETILDLLKQHQIQQVFIANFNSHQQLIISGAPDEINRFRDCLVEFKDISFVPLKVSGAFHSPFMESAKEVFSRYLTEFTFDVPTLPVLSNLNTIPYHPAEMISNLTEQMTHPVQWTKTMEYLLKQDSKLDFREIGPGNVLSGLLKRIKNGL